MPVRSVLFVSFTSNVSLLSFCVVDLSIDESEAVNNPL